MLPLTGQTGRTLSKRWINKSCSKKDSEAYYQSWAVFRHL